MTNICAVFIKQLKDTRKNKVVLIQFVLYPLMTMIMNLLIKVEDMPENYFTDMFAVMYIGMAPLMSMATVVSEEKEKGTLRALLMSGVRPFEYLIGIGSSIFVICLLGNAIMALTGGYTAVETLKFVLFAGIGIIISLVMGAAVGAFAESQMKATSMSVPLMAVFSFLPMIGMFNDTVGKIAEFTYTQQIQNFIASFHGESVDITNWLIVAGNAAVICVLFAFAYRKNRFD